MIRSDMEINYYLTERDILLGNNNAQAGVF
jgi:hypothetical protein